VIPTSEALFKRLVAGRHGRSRLYTLGVATTVGDVSSSSRAAGPGRVTAWAAVVVLTVYLVFAGGGSSGIYNAWVRSTSTLLIGVIFAVWAAVAWHRPSWRPGTGIWPAFAAALTVFVIGIALSRTPRLGLDYLAYAVLLTCLYLLLVRLWADRFFQRRLAALTVGLALVICVVYIGVVASHWAAFWSLVGAIVTPPLRPWFEGLTFGNPSAVMTMALLLLAPSIAHLGFGSRARRITVGGLVALGLVVTLLSGSRAGWLGLAIGIAVTVSAWLLPGENRAIIRRLLGQRRTQVALGVVAIVGVAFVLAFGPGILLRVGAGGEDARGVYFSTAARMFEASPLAGVGPGGWAASRIILTRAGEIDFYVPHDHNLYLQTAAEFGLLGIAAGAVAVGCVLSLIAGAVRDPDPLRRRFGWAALFSVAYFGAHQLLDSYANMPAAMFAFALPLAYLDATSGRSIGLGRWSVPKAFRRAGPIALTLGAVASLGALAWSESVALPATAAVDAANRGDWSAALVGAKAAVAADPSMPAYTFTLGLAAAHGGDLALAATSFERTAGADDLPVAWLDLAAIRLQLGDTPGAREALARSLRLGLQHPGIDVAAAALDLRMGDSQAASDAVVEAILLVPSLAGDPFWTTDPGFSPRWPSILARSISTAGPSGAWEIALVGGDQNGARQLAGRLGPDDRELAQLVIDAWDGEPAAVAALEARARARPLDTPTIVWCARVTARAGDSEASLRYREWASGIDGFSGATAAEMRVEWQSGPGESIVLPNPYFYGDFTYRRRTPFDQLVPGLPQLTYR
jgi:O-antigen ligase